MRIVLRVPKRQVRIAAAAVVLIGLGAGAGVTAQTDPELLGSERSIDRALSVPALPHDRSLIVSPHPEERLQRDPLPSSVSASIPAATAQEPAEAPAPAPSSSRGQQPPADPQGQEPPAGEQQPPAGQQEPPAGEQGQQPPAGPQGEQAQPPAREAQRSLLSADERAALDLVEQIIREQEGVVMGTAFDYTPGNRRDPFRSLLVEINAVAPPSVRPPGVPGFLISEVDLKGIAEVRGRWHAMIIGTNQRAYFVEVGTELFDGHVVEIRPGEVLFQQVFQDALGVRRTREVTKRLRTTDGSGETP